MIRWLITALLCLTLAPLPGAVQEGAPPQLALVIGIDDYGAGRDAQEDEAEGFIVPSKLNNAVRDANMIASALSAQDFDVATVVNPDRRELRTAIRAFGERLRQAGPDAIGVFYFAGHGVSGRPEGERDIDNYLLPVETEIVDEFDLDGEAYPLRRVTQNLKPGDDGAVIIVLDACRDFAVPAGRSLGETRGLAETNVSPGTIIAYSAAPGERAADGRPGGNGPYATSLAAHIREARGTRITDIFLGVRNAVLNATNQRQKPLESLGLRTPVYIGGPPASAAPQDRRSQADRIRDAEAYLLAMGYNPGPVDGVETDETRAAALVVQTAFNWARPGTIDEEFVTLLGLLHGQMGHRAPGFTEHAARTMAAEVLLPEDGLFLRLDPGMHTAVIRRLSVSADGRLLATASHDKTVRLWSLPERRLVRTLRPPIGEGDEGKLYAVALSPDGRWLATGGWDHGFAERRNHYISIFDTATGALTHRLGPLPNVVNDLEISPNGTRLAAGLGGANGIRVWQVEHRPDSPPPTGEGPGERGNALTTRVAGSIQTPTFTPLPTDSDYGDRVYGLAFAPDGRLFTTSYDGQIRAYAPGAHATPAQKARAPGGERPFGIALSPDGTRLAVGYADTTQVSLLDPETLSPVGEADTSGLTNGDLGSVAWLADGRLAAAGRYHRAGDYQVQVWDGAGTGARTAWPGGPSTMMDLSPLPVAGGGGLVHGGHGPAWNLLSASGQRLADHGPPLADLRNTLAEHFTLSPDGRRLRFGLEPFSGTPVLFDLGAGGERPRLQAAPQPVAGLQPAETSRLDIDGWEDTTRPTLAGDPLTLEPFETARSLAIAPGGDSFILGASYWLRRYRADGTLDWQKPVPGEAWGVNLARAGGLVVAAYGDGTIRWHRASDGQELLALFIHYEPGKPVHALDWVLWTPDGYFEASGPGGEALIGWHVNRDPDREADFYPVETFADTFRRPDRIDAALDGL